eukprot:CAMPEP_0205961902 /NCGR_PEP_ID=MMETSP1459-20131121/69643_1 /ASSEMBLY_ACC=CAM_ASM_001120 /TAXON_ID=41880 /ORGANISM="Pycnococcus provasolii, Strain RCC931" /LENGTH=91 /DNA_ID=CAMNT_0053334657 /DNA_START=16 /DNA_END=287 /DNA_ORIENTATION=+
MALSQNTSRVALCSWYPWLTMLTNVVRSMVVPLSSGNSNDEVSSLSDSFFAPLCPPSSMASMIWFTTDFIFCSASTPDVPGGSSCCGGGGG